MIFLNIILTCFPLKVTSCSESCVARSVEDKARVCQCGGGCEERGSCCLDHTRSHMSTNVRNTRYKLLLSIASYHAGSFIDNIEAPKVCSNIVNVEGVLVP